MSVEPVTAYFGLGSNMGNRQQNLDLALDLLSHRLKMGRISSMYETDPQDNADQPRFLNLVCRVDTRLDPEALLVVTKGIERKLGRKPKTSNLPRPIDIDILFYGEQVIKTRDLLIPHPKLTERAFVLIPLVEIAPDLVHPKSGQPVREILEGITEKQGIFRWDNNK